MKYNVKKIVGAMCLLLLFVAYQACIMSFTHVHFVNGVYITHSHPFDGNHQHTKGSLLVIGQFSHFDSLESVVSDVPAPMRTLLTVFDVELVVPLNVGEALGLSSLRAPPIALS